MVWRMYSWCAEDCCGRSRRSFDEGLSMAMSPLRGHLPMAAAVSRRTFLSVTLFIGCSGLPRAATCVGRGDVNDAVSFQATMPKSESATFAWFGGSFFSSGHELSCERSSGHLRCSRHRKAGPSTRAGSYAGISVPWVRAWLLLSSAAGVSTSCPAAMPLA